MQKRRLYNEGSMEDLKDLEPFCGIAPNGSGRQCGIWKWDMPEGEKHKRREQGKGSCYVSVTGNDIVRLRSDTYR